MTIPLYSYDEPLVEEEESTPSPPPGPQIPAQASPLAEKNEDKSKSKSPDEDKGKEDSGPAVSDLPDLQDKSASASAPKNADPGPSTSTSAPSSSSTQKAPPKRRKRIRESGFHPVEGYYDSEYEDSDGEPEEHPMVFTSSYRGFVDFAPVEREKPKVAGRKRRLAHKEDKQLEKGEARKGRAKRARVDKST